MNRHAAFTHFLENVAPLKYEYHTIASWKSRFNSPKPGGGISEKTIIKLLNENGYTAQTLERWTLPESLPEFTILYVDKNGVGCARVNAKNSFAAYEQIREANPERKKLTDVTFCTIEQAINKLNEVIKFDNGE